MAWWGFEGWRVGGLEGWRVGGFDGLEGWMGLMGYVTFRIGGGTDGQIRATEGVANVFICVFR